MFATNPIERSRSVAGRPILALIAMALVGAFVSSTVLAANAPAVVQGDVLQKIVRYDDLDLHGSAGANVLYRRIESAAKSVCQAFDSRDLQRQTLFKQCVSDAIARAVATVDAIELSELHLAKLHFEHTRTVLISKQKAIAAKQTLS
jgi:UrcA family protein